MIVQSEYNSSVIKQSIDSIFEVVNNSMSTYRTNSIISRVNQSQNPVEVDIHFIEVFKKSQEIWNLSNGYFDPTAGSIVNLYGMGPNTNVQSINRYKIDRDFPFKDSNSKLSPYLRFGMISVNKMWHELSADGVVAIEAKGLDFDPAKMDAITTIPSSETFPAGKVVDVLESGYMYKQRVLMASRVVVASEE